MLTFVAAFILLLVYIQVARERACHRSEKKIVGEKKKKKFTTQIEQFRVISFLTLHVERHFPALQKKKKNIKDARD